MGRIVNIDGKLYSPEDAKVSVFDHGFLFGDSIYETMRTYSGRIFLLEKHLKRLAGSAEMLRLQLPRSLDEFTGELNRTVAAAGNEECYLRLIVTRGVGPIGLDMDLSKQPTYVAIVNPFAPLASDLYSKGVKVALVATRRNDLSTLSPRIKSSNLLNNVLAYMEAKAAGAFEGILCNMAGYVSEATGSNVFMVHDGKLCTPSLDSGLLEGVTRDLVIELAAGAKIPIEERKITPQELLGSDECFITSTTKEILPVNQIDEKRLSDVPGPITRRLIAAYDAFVGRR
jgi:branched-chain amino acid aminotransferase